MEFGFLDQIGTGILWQVLAGAFALIAALLIGVLVVQGRRVPPVVTGAVVFVVASSGTVVSLIEGLAWDPADLERMRLVATTAAASRMFALLVTLPIFGLLALLLAVAGARGEPRRFGLAGAGLVAVLVTVGVTVAGGYAVSDPTFSNVRAAVYLGAGLLTCVAMLAGNPDSSGPEAGAGAALGYTLLVAAGECSRRGLFELLMVLSGAPAAAKHVRTETVDNFYAFAAPELPWNWATVAAACLVGVVGVVGVSGSGGRRAAGALAGLIFVPLALLLFGVGEVGPERMAQFAEALP